MFLFVDSFLLSIALGLLVPIMVLFVECSAAFLLDSRKSKIVAQLHPTVNVLIPARNEASCIHKTLETVLPQLSNPEDVVVVAHNCTDDTANIARKFKVRVIERQDHGQWGKGYALDYGVRFIEEQPKHPDVVVIVDADCIVHEGAIELIAQQAEAHKRPVQATYLMEQPPVPNTKNAVSVLAFMVKNLVRPRGLNQLGLPCLLTGTGMAFPWAVIQKAPLATSNIVEDMQLGLDLAIAGSAPIFCEQAKITSRLPQDGKAVKKAKIRWELGYLQTLLTQVPKLFKESITQRRFDLLALSLDMCVLPLSLLVIIWATFLVGTLVAGASGGSWIPATLLALEGILIFVSIIGAWAKFGRETISGWQLLAIPLFVVWKVAILFSPLFKPSEKITKTERDAIETPES